MSQGVDILSLAPSGHSDETPQRSETDRSAAHARPETTALGGL